MSSMLFLENREKTHFWAAVARVLIARGHDISWLVQNPAFRPENAGRIILMPFPQRDAADTGQFDLSEFPSLVTDRGRQYFDAGSAHYQHYLRIIEAQFEAIQPQMVVGEATLFHELLAVDVAERRGVAFVHPTAERYPNNRFSLYTGPTQIPYILSGDVIAPDEAAALSERISTGREIPRYMRRKSRAGQLKGRLVWAATRGRVWAARLAGERYNTPSLAKKIALSRKTAANVKKWDALASVPSPEMRAILYPLQLQPEASIDVWGRPFSDQVETIRRLLAATTPGGAVAVKANPKEKYEMSDALLALAASDRRVMLLPRTMVMREAQAATIGSVTVCGTVGLEAVFGRGRCISLCHPVIDAEFPDFAAATPEEAVRILYADPEAGRGSARHGERLLAFIANQSFPGLVSDPFSTPECLDPENVESVSIGVEAAWRHAGRIAARAEAA